MFLWSKTRQDILQLLQEKNPKLDVATFTTTDPKWYDKQKSHVIVYRALKDGGSGEMPVVLAGGVFADLITATGAKLFADWLAIPGDRKSMDWWHFKRVGEGGWWEEIETPIAEAELEGLVLDAVCAVLRIPLEHLRRRFLNGSFLNQVVRRLGAKLFVREFSRLMDTKPHLLQFSCGMCLNTDTWLLEPGRPEYYITKTTGYPWPAEAIAACTAAEAGLSKSFSDVFARIKEFERLPGDYSNFPQGISDDLVALTNLPCFTLMGRLHKSFDVPDYGWPVTVLRCIKCPAAALCSMATQKSLNDVGDGSNGKGYLATVLEFVFGQYSAQVKEEMLTQPPPSAESPSPELLRLRGVRIASTPEVEGRLKVKSAFIKRFADPTAMWYGRDLYSKRVLAFRMVVMFTVCTNSKLLFSTMDGGVMRRALSFRWPLQFLENPDPNIATQKARDSSMDSEDVIRGLVPGLLYILMAAAKIFCTPGSAPLHPLPKAVAASTQAMISDENADLINELFASAALTNSPHEAMTKPKMVAYLVSQQCLKDAGLKRPDIEAAMDAVFEFKTLNGYRNLARRRSDGRLLKA